MKALFIKMRDALLRGESLVLCSIIASSGSTPRGRGAKLALFADGSTEGTVGGGAVEYESIKLAKKALLEKAAFIRGFDLSGQQTAGLGMICGGKVTVYFQYFAGGDREAAGLFGAAASFFDRSVDSWLITEIDGRGAGHLAVFERETGLLPADCIPLKELEPLFKPRAMLTGGEPAYYVEPLTRAGTVYIFGGGHVSQELTPLLAHIGFRVAVFEDRPEFASPALFPAAQEIAEGDFQNIFEKISLTPEDYAVVMTRGHQLDFEVLSQVLRTPARYIGVIGSRRKMEATNARLIESGIAEAQLGRIHSPIGLAIGAETPAEIAVSIAAELILHRAGKEGARP